ncbi:MAG: magnesium protoporphyrin IX methyltransferase [Gammaproteobacteria bacterium]|jgi:magnesium-protoporphyrin O-methyltransferase|nr:magnesium protoporphyrin IX methyltransferase [Gammaproteobacteria bacterium]
MPSASYQTRRDEIETYFDRTAADAWAALTSDAPVSRIRRTVRSGRDAMRATLLSWLPEDLNGSTLIDAGCGTGTLAIEAAQRGAEVVAVDLSPTLINLARERLRELGDALDVTFLVGDMRDMDLGCFDYAVAMDSLIHYNVADGVQTLEAMAEQINRKIVFTFAPKTPLLALMHATGRLFPRADRAPSIEPVSQQHLCRRLEQIGLVQDWDVGRSHRVDVGFYKSQAMELTRR